MQIAQSVSDKHASEDDIRAIELKLNCRLPEDYRRFLTTANGGKPQERFFEITAGDRPSKETIRAFFAIGGTPKQYDIMYQISQFSGRYPEMLLAIGCDSFGNLLLLDLGAKNNGAVYFWDHERESMNEPTWENISLVATSFQGFVDSLH
jgi:hypothetical protein